MEVHEVEDDAGGEVAGCVAHFHSLVYVDELDVGEIGLVDGFVVGNFGVYAGYVVFYCVVRFPS